jgi:hypothetical protein
MLDRGGPWWLMKGQSRNERNEIHRLLGRN